MAKPLIKLVSQLLKYLWCLDHSELGWKVSFLIFLKSPLWKPAFIRERACRLTKLSDWDQTRKGCFFFHKVLKIASFLSEND